MQYNFRGTYDSSQDYNKLDVVVYQATPTSPKRFYLCLTSHTNANPQPPVDNQDTVYWGVLNSDSNFPNSIDDFITRTTMTASDKADYNRYTELFLKTSLTPAEQDEMSTLLNKLRNKILQPEDFNKLQSALQNMQFFLKNEVEGYINQKQAEFQSQIDKFTDKGEYSPTTTYYRNNFVTYQGQTYICTVDGTINIPPTNTSNWRLVAAKGQKGDKGDPGLNLVYRGTYDPTIQYTTGDAVEYGGSIYYATQDNIGETPQSNGTSWTIFMPRASVLVSPTPPSSPTDKQVWVDSSNNIFKFYNSSTSSWVELNANDAKTLGGKTLSEIQADYNNKISEHSADYVKHPAYAVATGSANAYSVTLNPAPTSYVEGMAIAVKINVDNTGAATINVNGLGAKAIKKPNGNDVSAGNLKAGSIYTLRYNGTNFILQGEGGSGNAQPQYVLSGYTFTNDNGEQTGTMPNRGAMTITPTTSDQVIPQGYHNGSGIVKGDPNLIAANIVAGKTIFGVAGSFNGKRWASGTATSSSSTTNFQYAGSGSGGTTLFSVTVTGLTFKPSTIIMIDTVSNSVSVYSEINDGFYPKTVKVFLFGSASASVSVYNIRGDVSPAYVNGTGFCLPAWSGSKTYTWIAIE
jgi:hypothetical protein